MRYIIQIPLSLVGILELYNSKRFSYISPIYKRDIRNYITQNVKFAATPPPPLNRTKPNRQRNETFELYNSEYLVCKLELYNHRGWESGFGQTPDHWLCTSNEGRFLNWTEWIFWIILEASFFVSILLVSDVLCKPSGPGSGQNFTGSGSELVFRI